VLGGYAVERAAAGLRLPALGLQLTGVLLAALVLAEPLVAAVATDRALLERDVMVLAADWVDAHVRAGSKIAVEFFGALPDVKRYTVLSTGHLIEHDATWYRTRGYTWFAAGAVNYQRYFDEADSYPKEAAAYRGLFAKWEPVTEIEGPSLGRPGFRITIWRALAP
jgi:hypothetical protein